MLSQTYVLAEEKAATFAIKGLSFRYPHGPLVLRGIDLTIVPGDRLAIVGPNGSGKSTLVRHLNGLLQNNMGSLHYKGHPLTGEHLKQARHEIGLLFQDPDDHLFCNTLFEDIAFGPMNKGLLRQKVEQIVGAQLKQVGLLEYRDKAAHCLSYGQKKRAALAAVMAMEPEILVLDEPTANLDPKQIEIIIALLNDYHGTLLCISHDLFFLQEICSRALVLEKGRVHHDFSMEELMAAPSALRVHGLDSSFRYSCCGGHNDEAEHDHHHHMPPQPLQDRDSGGSIKKNVPQDKREPGYGVPLIDLCNFSYTYPDNSMGVDGVTVTIQRGESVALVGENGAGKSTLALCLMGILEGRGGYSFLETGITRKNRKTLWRDIGIIFQDCADQLFCSTCWDEVAFGLRQKKLPKKEIDYKVQTALAMVKLDGYEQRSPLDMSGGERKRLAIAAAISLGPKVLIMDEPTAGLDPKGEEMFLAIVENLDMTKILISHNMFFVRRTCQRALVMHQGRLIYDCGIDEFFNMHLVSENMIDYQLQACSLQKV